MSSICELIVWSVRFTLSCISGATPVRSSSCTISSYSFAAARWSEPMPESVLAFTLHRAPRSSRTVSRCPFQQARCSGVHPSLLWRSRSTFADARVLMTLEWPFSEAQWSVLEPLLSVMLLLILLLLIRVAMVLWCPFHEAQWRGVHPYCN